MIHPSSLTDLAIMFSETVFSNHQKAIQLLSHGKEPVSDSTPAEIYKRTSSVWETPSAPSAHVAAGEGSSRS